MLVLASFVLGSLVAWVVLGWSRLSGSLRLWISRLLLAGGILSLLIAPFLPGGYAQDVELFIGGPYPYHVETIQRSYTGLALGIAAAFFVLYAASRFGSYLPGEGTLAQAFRFSLAVILFRVYFEKLGVPAEVARLIGLIWLSVPLGVYFGLKAAQLGRQWRFWIWLVGYAFGIRFFILIVMLLATHFHLGTHFDNSSVTSYRIFEQVQEVEANSWEQYRNLIVFPQLVLWPLVTIVLGAVAGWPAYFIIRRRRPSLVGK